MPKSKNRSPKSVAHLGIQTPHSKIRHVMNEYKKYKQQWRKKWQRTGIDDMTMVSYHPLLGFDTGLQCDHPGMRHHKTCKSAPRSKLLLYNGAGCSPHRRQNLLSKGAFGKAYKSCCKNKCDFVTKYIRFHSKYSVHDFYREVLYGQVAGRARIAPEIVESYVTKTHAVIMMEKLERFELMNEHEKNLQVEDAVELRSLARRLARRIGKLILSLHSLGILHHDAHDSNIVMDKSGKWKLIDFGMATEFSGDIREDLKAIQRDYDTTLLYNKRRIPSYTRHQWAYVRHYYKELYKYMQKDMENYRKHVYSLQVI